MTKQEKINLIILDIKENHYSNRDLVLELVREALQAKTNQEIKDLWLLIRVDY